MKWIFEDKHSSGHFLMVSREPAFGGRGFLKEKKDTINTLVYNRGTDQTVTIDEISYIFPANAVLPLVANQRFLFEHPEHLTAWQFNREFYCIADHDAEVGCVGFLFYGIQHPFFIHLTKEDEKNLAVIEQLCIEDMHIQDGMQGEMLRTLLKRLIIQLTRIAKKQTDNYRKFSEERMDLVRTFNLLLEAHFRTQHEVRFYAQQMNKSPKTLANIFSLCHYPSPSRLIQQRIILEAKRYLYYTDKSAKEIGDELGFTSPAHFSRFFKLNTGLSFSAFKASLPLSIQ